MFVTPIQTRWNDLDPFAHVNNSRYVSYLEIGRVDYCQRKFAVKDIYDVPFLLARIEIDLLKPVELQHKIEVVTCVSKIGNKSWEFTSIVREHDTNVHFAKAKTIQVSYDHRTKSSIPIPDWIRRILNEDLELFRFGVGP
ncbi:acyl-CoA thioester hydrolase, YbgC/YbaW family [Leptospira fainei serovar Hurstbridge str. BUT 6]|uniref:Acyl-CoA thioester hydrolase, YbgC/YbaW family n=1 Tax=Leptospira fainei serovar Hurstbridge str. BUT 6 TaxID=1193011 RepID=S3VAS8_9LEPT|nr:thioesterase family protein [Leptospira fainei]EPG73530.1 acyl-CoA thioester hydrolase, YbgC/YbaW family [Leptospira fainei serovar Hurstbridge str. BUT 6]